VLARSASKHIDPNDDVPVVLEDEPAVCVDPKLHLWIPNGKSAKKAGAPKRKVAKAAKRKSAKNKSAKKAGKRKTAKSRRR
jgi:hypothetical protein